MKATRTLPKKSKKKSRETVTLKVRRQDHPKSPAYWEIFVMPMKVKQTVLDLLDKVAMKPINSRRESTTPVVFESACGVGSCGACSMLINGRVMPACQVTVGDMGGLITLEPMKKFPVLRDLAVDRSAIENNFQQAMAWSEYSFNGSWSGFGFAPKNRMSLCNQCGHCMEASNQFYEGSSYMGDAALTQSYQYFRLNGQAGNDGQRQTRWMGTGGIEECGLTEPQSYQCPMGIPLTTVLGEMSWEVTKESFKRLFKE